MCVCVLFVHRRCKSLSPFTVICRKEMSTQNAFKNINHLNYLLHPTHRVQNLLSSSQKQLTLQEYMPHTHDHVYEDEIFKLPCVVL
jgi:hypothetical protein